ncbi:MAG: hypothetical protein M1827_002377 [Pycnora praestabilis]|nr:MAG: hypothetical protein M1827_002377 [Pycnora praestabilis]
MSFLSGPKKSISAPDLEILGDRVTLHPAGFIEPPRREDESHERNLVEHMARFRESPLDFLHEVSLHISGSGWRAYDDFIGQPIFYSGFTDNMKAAVMSTPMLQGKIEELAGKRLEVEKQQGLLNPNDKMYAVRRADRRSKIEDSLREVAERLTDGMICKFESKSFIRGAYYMCTQLLTRAYHQGLALPTVVAGDNLNFPLVGKFLQSAGAMWIRRSFGDDALYTTLVQSYIDTLLQNGFNFECFIEGGRSRTGKLLPPKFGILSFFLDSVLSGRVEDAIVCPVSTQYDKVIETESYISELLGQPKPKENLRDFLSASSVLSLQLGRVDVRFHEPWSLKTFILLQRDRLNKTTPQVSLSDMVQPEVKGRLLRTLGYKVLSDINAVSVVMPTALIGTVLLTLRGRGVGKVELIRRVEWLCERVRRQGGRIAHFAGAPTSVVVDRGLEVLGPGLVGTVEDLPEQTYYAVDRFQLSFYRNMTIHLFISEALVSAGMYIRVKQGGGPDNQRIAYSALADQVAFLSQLFRGEFIFPTEGFAVNLERTLQGLEADDIVKVTRNTARSPGRGEIKSVELSDAERCCGRENYDFYCFLIWPFIEASWLGAVSLMGLTPPNGTKGETWLNVKQTQDRAQLLGKTLYHQGDLSYFEAVNKETLKNAYQRFEEEGIILIIKSKDSRVPSKLRLAPEWQPSRHSLTGTIAAEGRLWDFTERIAQSRREGKNRRDGATVSTRVLALADRIGQALYQSATATLEAEPEDGQAHPKKRRRQGIQAKARL